MLELEWSLQLPQVSKKLLEDFFLVVVKQMLESWKLLCGGVGVSFSAIPGGGIFFLGPE